MGIRKTLISTLAGVAIASPLHEHAKRQGLPVGTIINSCTVSGVAAITFDDGPGPYTSQLLDILASNGAKVTFFMNGQNYGNINDNAAVVQRAYNEGHQIASHTWSHADLATLNAAGITSEMTQLETALLNIIGRFPTYMRPPYLSTNAQALSTLGSLGYHVIQLDIDTLDWEGDYTAAYNNYVNGLDNGGRISLSHDPLQQTVQVLAQQMLDAVRARGLRTVTVGECLGDAAANWYRTSRDGGSTPPPTGGNQSPDGTCGGTQGYVCPGTECCSQYGYCGTTGEYCDAGCQTPFGQCGGGSTPPPTGGNESPNGQCGGTTGWVCPSGLCCSQYGWCGTGPEYGC